MILVAGIGNLFRADDGFGCQVVARLRRQELVGVEVRDFGTRGYDLALAICQDWERVILVDTIGPAGPPGSLHLIEPQAAPARPVAAHSMTPEHVLSLVEQLGGKLPPLVLLGCVPDNLGRPEELNDRLSPVVSEAAERAVQILRELVAGCA